MFEINIEDIPILNKDIYANTDSSNPRTLISLVIVTDFLRGILKDNTVCSYTQEQIDELKKYHITPSMNFSPPSISDSKSDVESYKVDFGSKSLNVLSNKFKSGNFYLDRRFSIPGIEKLSLPLLLENDIRTLELKVLGARAKEDEAEKLVVDTYKYLFNMSENKGLVGESLDYQLDALKDALNSKDTLRLKNLQSLLSKQLDTLYKTSFLPIIIGLRLNRIAYEGLNIKFTLDLDNSDYLIDIKP